MPVDYSIYHPDWLTKIRPRILIRANYRCELCGREHLKWYFKKDLTYKDSLDDWMIEKAAQVGQPIVKVVLTIAHLNHDVTDNRDTNLKALCQRCHLNHDRANNIMKRKANKAVLGGSQKNKIIKKSVQNQNEISNQS
jgi:hypothetical protein